MNYYRLILIYIVFLFWGANSILAQLPTKPPEQKPPLSRILFIFDASQSMNGTWEKSKKIDIARNVLISMLDSLEKLDNIEVALRVYGHQKPVPPQDCSDSKLEVPFAKGNASRIRQKLRFIEPKGTTPIANSLSLSSKDFSPQENCRNIIILITDGIEACDGDPCAVSQELQKQGITLKPFIIGIGIDENFKKSFDCIGQYYNAAKEDKFKEVLNVVISQALNSTTAQVNLLDITGKPTETNVAMSFYDYYSGKLKHNYMHTMNHRGNPDTLFLDPLVTYRLTVHTIPPVFKDTFKLVPGKHTIIALDAPQGYLVIKAGSGLQARSIPCIIRKAGDMNTLNYQDVNRTEKYLVGKYDIEIPVLPKILLYNIEVSQSSTTTVQIPPAGMVTFLMIAPGYGSVYLRENGKGLKWVYNLGSNAKSESLTLQAGSYTIVYRAMNAKQTLYTISKNFDVQAGSSNVIELN